LSSDLLPVSALPSSSESVAAVDPPLVDSNGTPGLNSPSLASVDLDQPDPCGTPLPTTPPPTQRPAPRKKASRGTRGGPTPLTPPPTQHLTQKSPSLEGLADTLPPLTPRRRTLLAFVEVPPRPKKRPLLSSDTSEECDSRINSGCDDPNVWNLGDRHPTFLHDAEEFFLGVPGDDDWWTLLSRYVEFEGLAPQVRPHLYLSRLNLIEFPGERKTFDLLAS